MLEVYRDITSPSAEVSFVDDLDAPDEVKHRLSWVLANKPEGVQSDLFPYQHATLAKMLARELAPQDIPSPTFLRRSTRVGGEERSFFVSLDGGVRLEPLTVREPKGGILAEDMGVGKTLMVLALVMTTLSELPKLDGVSTYLDGSPSPPPSVLLTDVSVDFPFPFEMCVPLVHTLSRSRADPPLVHAPPGPMQRDSSLACRCSSSASNSTIARSSSAMLPSLARRRKMPRSPTCLSPHCARSWCTRSRRRLSRAATRTLTRSTASTRSRRRSSTFSRRRRPSTVSFPARRSARPVGGTTASPSRSSSRRPLSSSSLRSSSASGPARSRSTSGPRRCGSSSFARPRTSSARRTSWPRSTSSSCRSRASQTRQRRAT